MKPLTVGLVGMGSIARTHCMANAAITLNPAALSTPIRMGKLLRQNTAAPLPFFFEGYAASLAELIESSDVIDICSSNDAHFAQATAVLSAGKPLYLEKPVAAHLSEAEEVAALAEQAGVPNQVALMYRFMPAIVAMRDLVQRGEIGTLIDFSCCIQHSGYLNPARKANWKLKKEASGGGPLLDIGVHSLDMIRFVLGEVAAVRCKTDTVIRQRPDAVTGAPIPVDVEDWVKADLSMACGCSGRLEITRVASVLAQSSRFSLYGTAGSLHFDAANPKQLRIYRQSTGEEVTSTAPALSEYGKYLKQIYPKTGLGWLTDAHTASLLHFYRTLTGETAPFAETPTIREAVIAQRLVSACYRAADEDREIVLG